MKKYLPVVLASLLSTASVAGEMKNLNTYIGAGAGISKDEILDRYYNETIAAGKLFAGITYNTYSGLEASYAYLGNFANSQIQQQALALNLAAFIPLIENLRLIAKGGIYYYQLDVSSSSTGTSINSSDNGNNLTFGLGLKYNFDYRNALRAEWERYKDLGGSDVDMYSVSYSYRFGRQ